MIEFISEFFKKNKKLCVIIGIAVLAAVIILLLPSGSAEEKKTDDGMTLSEYKAALEGEMSEICSSVSGVGKCIVSISFSKGAEKSYKSGNLISSAPPEVLGVVVVCRGAGSDKVRLQLTELFVSLFDIPSGRVAILPLK